MVEQTTPDGLTAEQMDAAYAVLETMRENHESEGRSSMAEIINEAHYLVQQYEQNATWLPDFDVPDEGDIVVDTESNFGSGEVEVVNVLNRESRTHYIEKDTGKRSISYLNPGHPPDAPVVEGRYVEGGDKLYAFPVTRLE